MTEKSGHRRSLASRVLKGLGAVLAALLLMLAAVIGWSLWTDSRAEQAAAALCAAIRPGVSLQEALALGHQAGARWRSLDSSFVFQGSVHQAALCVLRLEGERVVATQTRRHED